MSYTKGPWVLSEVDNVYVHIPHSKLPYYLRVLPEESNVADSEDYANARLIAAAPELVEALEQVRNFLRRLGDSQPKEAEDLIVQHVEDLEDMLVEVLTNAKGGQP